jgi:hypothetical protein
MLAVAGAERDALVAAACPVHTPAVVPSPA